MLNMNQIEQAVGTDGGIQLAKDFGRGLAEAGSTQLLCLAYAILEQTGALKNLNDFTAEEHDFVEAARSVIEAYTFARPVQQQCRHDES